MRGLAIAQLSGALLTACTPWLVASIALRVATSDADVPAPHIRSLKPLRAMTVGAAVATTIATVILGRSPWMLLVAALGFGGPAVVASECWARLTI